MKTTEGTFFGRTIDADDVFCYKFQQPIATAAAGGNNFFKSKGNIGGLNHNLSFLLCLFRGIPVCAHIGLTPQSVHAFGGYKVQGKADGGAALMADAKAHDAAGAAMILMECVPAALGKAVTEAVAAPTIGIGAGVDCDGQVLVMHDMLGVFPGHTARFVKNFMAGQDSIQAAVKAYVAAVKNKTFPAAEHSFL